MTISTDRFSRQAALVPLDRMADKLVTVIGVGAIGRQVALQLASIGVRHLQLIDFDTVESTNITTQGYLASDVGVTKVLATTLAIERIDPTIEIDMIIDRYRRSQQVGQVIFCCVDSITARSAIWRSLRGQVDLFVDGRMRGEVLRVLTASNDSSVDYYATTLFAPTEAQQGACTSHGTIYTASIAAGLMVQQFTRWLRNLPTDRDLSCNLLASELVVC
ncbi:Molybdopterin-synthase adenylyltransferase [Novipirellula aureliae]|uniref:Molybdopterin-synthase adenylyltransferase n=1 Tax=Novipirellula aureliae TaxID=2527966 RepID=A0A5C6D621_9BACT|nr:ThiF family adenylyltransferase [Novipirellula aureliae]TWU31505.1 Molybdopterin-synthase adenylyltransferase [Novipirellula aureliae]